MRQNHKTGETCLVDCCDELWLLNPKTAVRHRTQLFVGCLEASSFTVAETTVTQQMPDWISFHVHRRKSRHFQL